MIVRKPFEDISSSVMILGAGFGTRLHPLTLHSPKPLVEIGGRTLLSYHLEHSAKAGFTHAVVNAHYKSDHIKDYLRKTPMLPVSLSVEKNILDTGGGVANVLSHFHQSFFVINSDTYTTGDLSLMYAHLKKEFQHDRMDALLLLCPLESMHGYEGKGDFTGEWHKGHASPITFFNTNNMRPACVYLGLQLINIKSFISFVAQYYPEYLQNNVYFQSILHPFSMVEFWKICAEKGRLFGYEDRLHDWFDTGNHRGLFLASQAVKKMTEIKQSHKRSVASL